MFQSTNKKLVLLNYFLRFFAENGLNFFNLQ